MTYLHPATVAPYPTNDVERAGLGGTVMQPKRTHLLTGLAVVLIAGTHAAASDALPRYDVETSCDRIARAGGVYSEAV